MINIQLLELAIKQIKTFSFDNESDVIKVEKILKAEEKLNSKIQINDIEKLISFLNIYKGTFTPFFKDENISRMLRSRNEELRPSIFNPEQILAETLNEFRQVFEENIYNYLTQRIRISDWESLKIIYNGYGFLVSDLSLEKINQVLSSKNNSIIQAIKNNQSIKFIEVNAFAVDPNYYTLLSTINAFHFDDDIFKINNIISQNQHTSHNNKINLGKILFAACYYNPHDDGLKKTLSQNQQIAYLWLSPSEQKKENYVTNKTLLVSIGIALGIILIFAIANKSIFGASVPISIAIGILVYFYIRKKQQG